MKVFFYEILGMMKYMCFDAYTILCHVMAVFDKSSDSMSK